MANYRCCIKWKETKAAPAKQASQRARKSSAADHTAAPKALKAGTSDTEMNLGEG